MNGPINIPIPSSAGHTLRSAAVSAAAGDSDQAALILLRHRNLHRPSLPDTFSVNTILKILSLSPAPRRAIPFFFRMLAAGFSPNAFTFPPLSAAAARSPDLTAGELSHAQALKRGAITSSVNVANAFITMYASCGLACGARALFDEMPRRDVVSWNAMVDAYVKVGDLGSAREMFEMMPERNVVSWNGMINGYLKGRRPQYGLKLFREMMGSGFAASVTTLVTVVTACGRLGAVGDGKSVHGHYVRRFGDRNLVVGTALVDMYCRCGKVEVGRRVFDLIGERNLVCWNAMIRGHCIHGFPEDGLSLFEELVSGNEFLLVFRLHDSFILVLLNAFIYLHAKKVFCSCLADG